MNKVLIIDDDKELCALIKRSVLAVMGNGDVTGYVYIVKTHAL